MESRSHKELEEPVKGYELQAVTRELSLLTTEIGKMSKSIENISNQTKGVVIYDQMTQYVDKRIIELTKPLFEFKKNGNKLGWLVVGLLLTDIAARILK